MSDEFRGIALYPASALALDARHRVIAIPGVLEANKDFWFVLREADGGGRYVSETGWQSQPHWLVPVGGRRRNDVLLVGVPPEVAQHVPSGHQMICGLSFDGENYALKGLFTWRVEAAKIQPSAAAPADSDTRLIRTHPGDLPPSQPQRSSVRAPDQEHAAPTRRVSTQGPSLSAGDTDATRLIPAADKLAPSRDRTGAGVQGESPAGRKSSPGPRRQKRIWIALTVVFLTVAAGFGAYTMMRNLSPELDAHALQQARELLESDLAPEEQLAAADRWRDNPEGAMVVYRSLADRGSGPAATRMGRILDPVDFGDRSGAVQEPDPGQAVCWYAKAIKLGDENATPHLERLVSWVRDASMQGDTNALAALSLIADVNKCLN